MTGEISGMGKATAAAFADLMQNGYPPININFTGRKKYYAAFDVIIEIMMPGKRQS